MSHVLLGIESETALAHGAAATADASLEKRRLRIYLGLLLGDCAAIITAAGAAGWLYEDLLPHRMALRQAQLLLPIYLTIALYNGSYSLAALTELRVGIGRAVCALLIATGLLGFVVYHATAGTTISRGVAALSLLIACSAIAVLRVVAQQFIARRWQGRLTNILIVDEGGPRFALSGARLLDAKAAGLDPESQHPAALDRLGRFFRHQDTVVVSCTPDRRQAWASVLKAAGVTGEVLSETAHAIGVLAVTRYEAQRQTGLVVATGPLGLRARAAKRLFDLATAVSALILLAPLLIGIALAIRLGDGGPVLFVQPRVGRGNRIFRIIKFRTMREACGDLSGSTSTARSDRRVTAVGRLLRRTSLDELPQLWNVLRGDMSIVGPRPHALAAHAGNKRYGEIDVRYRHRHCLRPGLTGLAQVRGLRGTTYEEEELAVRLQADLEYIADWSLLSDLAIMLRTLLVLAHSRAY